MEYEGLLFYWHRCYLCPSPKTYSPKKEQFTAEKRTGAKRKASSSTNILFFWVGNLTGWLWDNVIFTLPETKSSPWKMVGPGRQAFPFGKKPMFRCELLVYGRVIALILQFHLAWCICSMCIFVEQLQSISGCFESNNTRFCSGNIPWFVHLKAQIIICFVYIGLRIEWFIHFQGGVDWTKTHKWRKYIWLGNNVVPWMPKNKWSNDIICVYPDKHLRQCCLSRNSDV